MNTPTALMARARDKELDSVCTWAESMSEASLGGLFRSTYDQVYDGARTGRYKLSQLYKTEKIYFGTIIEINLQRWQNLEDGNLLDYKINGIEVDCKYSIKEGGWMIPKEALGHICLLCSSVDEGLKRSTWSLGVIRVIDSDLSEGRNQDKKHTLNEEAKNKIWWIHHNKALPLNLFLSIPQDHLELIFKDIDVERKGQERVNHLLRCVQQRPIPRNAICTVARQLDPMKRVRKNGGARSTLKHEGILVLCGHWQSHQKIVHELNLPAIDSSEFIATKVEQVDKSGDGVAYIENNYWRAVDPSHPVRGQAPELPD
ncbi:MAG: restriction endonuclease [Holophagaceae bacterium]|nr:restriction endonuclease [Holophagaceae bacterium]